VNHGTTLSKKAGGIIYEHNFYKRIVNANQVAPSEKMQCIYSPSPSLMCHTNRFQRTIGNAIRNIAVHGAA
jgi:hypothetical protein